MPPYTRHNEVLILDRRSGNVDANYFNQAGRLHRAPILRSMPQQLGPLLSKPFKTGKRHEVVPPWTKLVRANAKIDPGGRIVAGEQRLDDGALLSILVEKDFACLAPREGEDDSDMYAHPEADNEQAQC